MSNDPNESPKAAVPLKPTRTIAAENKVCVRTIERWVEQGILPEPMRINNRRYWPEGTMPKADKAGGST